jgi:uracil-DNA glycosylase family 4
MSRGIPKNLREAIEAKEKRELSPRVTNEHACLECPFKSRTCGSIGPQDSPFVIVGESPGQNEAIYGVPFIGESGELLRKMLASSGYLEGTHIEPYITNAVKCLPTGKKDQSSMANACKSCRANLIAEVAAFPRKVILALGASAVWSLTGDYRLKITQVRGQIFPSALAEYGIVATVHPAFLLRGGGSLPKFISDVKTATNFVRGIERVRYKDSTHTMLATPEDLRKVLQTLRGLCNGSTATNVSSPIYVGTDIETSGFSALEDHMLCHFFGWEDTHNYGIPKYAFKDPEYLSVIKELMEFRPEKVRYVWHNGKFDIQFFWELGIAARVDEDLMLLSYALDENKGLHDLEQVSNDAVAAPNWKGMLDAYRPNKDDSYEVIPPDVLHLYAGKDVSATLQSWRVLRERVRNDRHLEKLYTKVLIPSSFTLACIEFNGMEVDFDQQAKNEVRLQEEMYKLQYDFDTETIKLCNRVFNFNSPPQVSELLYEILKVPPIAGAINTRKSTLEALPKDPLISMILKFRKHSKAYGTYVRPLVEYKDEKGKLRPGHVKMDGRVHATYLLHGTVTGRLASRKPNMQNPPRDAEIRGQFCAAPDHMLIEVDLNQAELRCLAELSGCPDLMSIYLDKSHPGLHHEVSVTLFGEDYTDEDKMRAKAVNFGIVYGRTGASIADEFDMDPAEGERWVTGWAARFPVAWQFIQRCREAPLQGHLLITPFGRKRRFGVVNKQNMHSVQNEASNFPHQSIASDITLVANGKVIRHPDYRARIVNLVHDAGIHEVKNEPELVDQQASLIQQHMQVEATYWGLNKVPFQADVKIGTHWGRLNKYKIKGDHKFCLLKTM